MRFDVSVESKALASKLKRIEGEALAKVSRLVDETAAKTKAELQAQVGKSVSASKRKTTGRSRPGQPPRKDTGRYQASIRTKKISATKSYVTVDATDAKGNRYPFMLESGTKYTKKRPVIKRVQRKIKKEFVAKLVAVARSL